MVRHARDSGGAAVFSSPAPAVGSEPLSTPHTVTVLIGLISLFTYAALYAGGTGVGGGGAGGAASVKSGLAAAACMALVFCAWHLRDTLFVRPHPALWRAVTGVGLLYCMATAFVLFQPVAAGRALMRHVDPSLPPGPPEQQSYGDKCDLTPANLAVRVCVCARVRARAHVWAHMRHSLRHSAHPPALPPAARHGYLRAGARARLGGQDGHVPRL